ncbi:regulatory inactivation of DnaA Hda protein [Nitrosomonas cryotolerans]|uniref:Regulatory inactivation of DnaA Hda protein n=1 Tax=Nitrosomonas cryotolerans ATCC 49181 TaxID=1131553 RepID=A0A1N6JD13_9PROT|nr:DnaA regulatory inactivator Hda [Nitrosomonas cryotolerans]SFP49314.1 regulatory inactivation of DnaA Hda protein [Nitrosomonas cryotolerans]SIO42238.1 regulatory inactivation of DnaA Hda protein [Nitrosomonas cryotolerans ATCC 49181]
MKQLLLDIALTSSPTLTNFLPGRNAELLHMLECIIAGKERERFVYLWGGLGCGKSHLLRAVTETCIQNHLKAVYFACDSSCEFIVDSDIDCIVVDDVDRLNTSVSAQIRLFNLYNQIYSEGDAFLLVSGPVAPAQLRMRQDLVTRLGWGLVYQVHELTDEEKMQAMKSYAANCGFNLPQEVCDYLLRHGRRDLPSLMTTLDALDHYSLANQRPITIPLLRELLQQATP